MHGFIVAVNFLTRLNIGSQKLLNPKDLSKATFYFPLVGFLIGIILFIIAILLSRFLQPGTIAALILATEVLITGGLHLDGLIDTCDGLLSGQSQGKVLEIMKDSRVGGMGVIGLCLVLLVKWAFLTDIILGSKEQLYVLLLMPFIGRWAMTYALFHYPSARPEGMGQLFHNNLNRKGFFYVSCYCVILLLNVIFLHFSFVPHFVFWLVFGITAPVFLVTLGFICYLTKRINHRLGGLTGDTYGAINELTEVIFLGSWLLFSRIGSCFI